MPPIDDDLPAVDQQGGSAVPLDADGNPATDTSTALDDNGPIDVPDSDSAAPGDDVEMQPDGSAVVQLAQQTAAPDDNPQEHFANLADGAIDPVLLNRRALKYIEMVERDLHARKERDDQYAEGIKRTGMGGEAPGGADFEGASRAVHPVLAEGCIDFSAKAMKEIFPPSGPCKTKIIGKTTPEKTDKAERKRQYMNWQLTEQITEYRGQTKKTLTQLPLGGSQYKNWWYDRELDRPAMEFVPIDYVILPAGAQDFYSAQRITHIEDITEQTYLRRVDSGFYRDADNMAPSGMVPEATASQKASERVEGVAPDVYNQDGLRRVYVINSAFEAFDEDSKTAGEPAPYMWHIDLVTHQVLGLYRNWDPEDAVKMERLHWLVDYTFIHWRGPQGVGLLHLIGSLSGAVTGGVRSMLDKALAENSMSGIRLKGGRTSGTTEQPAVGETVEMEGPTAGSVDDIRKLFMPYPFNPSTPVLFTLVQWLVDQARGVVSVASEKLADGKTDMPVGSTLALIEQGSSVFSDIHAGLHHSQAQELKILHRLNKWYLKDKDTIAELGDLVVERADFQGPCDIIPVSDPLIFSETQRYAQVQAMHQVAANPVFQGKVNIDHMLEQTVQLLHLPDPDKWINTLPEPEDLDPVSENMCLAMGMQPIKAFEFQDHMAHLMVHLHFATSPMFGANPLMGPRFVPKLIDHCMEHMVLQYVAHSVAAAAAGTVAGVQATTKDARFAATMTFVDSELSQEFQELGQMFQKSIQLTQQYMQQNSTPPPDPASQAQLQIGMAEVNRKKAADDAEQKFEQSKLQAAHTQEMAQLASKEKIDQAHEQARHDIDAMVQAQKDQREQDRLLFDERSLQAKLANDQVLAEIKAGYQLQQKNFETWADAYITSLTAAQPQPDAAQSMAAGGAVKNDSPAGPVQVQQDPAHTAVLGKLHDVLSTMPDAHAAALDKHAQGQHAALGALVQALQASHTDLSGRLQTGLQGLSQLINHHTTVAGLGNQHGADLASAVAAMREVTDAIHETTGAQSDAVRAAFENLQKTMAAPRVRELRKDKHGNKSAVDRPAKDGEV